MFGLVTTTINIYSNIISFAAANKNISIQAGNTDLTISRSGIHNNVSVKYSTVDDTAIANTDYQPLGGTLTWQNGDDTDQIINLALLEKAMINKTLTVVLSNLTIIDSQTNQAVEDGILDTDTVKTWEQFRTVKMEMRPLTGLQDLSGFLEQSLLYSRLPFIVVSRP